jgi:hypothetical protein
MRFAQIQESIKLTESKNDVSQSLSTLALNIEKAEAVDQELADKAKEILSNIYNKAQLMFKKIARDQLKMPALSEDRDLKAKVEQMQLLIDAITQNQDVDSSSYIADLQRTLAQLNTALPKAIRKAKEEGRDTEFKSNKAYDEDFAALIEFLAHKAAGSLDAFEQHYKDHYQKDYIKNPKNQADIEFNATLKDNAKKQAPGDTVVIKAIKDTLTSVFGEAVKGASTRKELMAKRTRVKKFLGACVKGIIPLNDLFDQGSGNVTAAFKDTAYADLKEFFKTLLGKVPSSGGAGSWGPAELALAIVGTPVKKATKGDLNIGGRMYELKASKSAKAGGRVNTEALDRGKSGKGDYTIAWNAFCKDVLGIKLTGRNVEFKVKSSAANVKPGKEYLSKQIKFTSVGPTLINHVINPAILAKSKSGVKVNQATGEFLMQVALSPIIAEYKDTARKLFKVNDTVNRDGTIDAGGFLAAYLNMLMGLYNITDEVDSIIVINPDSGNFHVISATDTKSLHKKIKNGDIQTSSTWLDFDDAQSKASPQIGTA